MDFLAVCTHGDLSYRDIFWGVGYQIIPDKNKYSFKN